MHIRYVLLGVELVLLGIFLYPAVKNNLHAGIVFGAVAMVLCMIVTAYSSQVWELLQFVWQYGIGKIALSLVALCLAVGIGFCGVMSVFMVKTMYTKPQENDVVVVLGCRVRGDKPSRMLMNRLDTAEAYLQAHPEAVCIVCGGQGAGEDLSEAAMMNQYLIDAGISAERIYQDDTSQDTEENLEHAAEILKQEGLGIQITIVTSNFHEYRASILAKRCGLKSTALSAKTNRLHLPSYWVREWMALFQLIVLGHG